MGEILLPLNDVRLLALSKSNVKSRSTIVNSQQRSFVGFYKDSDILKNKSGSDLLWTIL